jgi:glycosyltransferase involved in cell wall biosynthesis
MDELNLLNNKIYVVTALERRNKKKTFLESKSGLNILRVRTGNIKKVNLIEKGITTITIEYEFLAAIKKYFNNVKFDLVLYSTPPITFVKVIKMIKKRDGAKSYLLLKDIFPQNAVDLGMIKKCGILHKIFRSKEKKLYKISDYIGCMSIKNKVYLLENNKFLNHKKVEVCPNSIKPRNISPLDLEEKNLIKDKIGIPKNALVLIYGGNLGKPQGIDFMLRILSFNKNRRSIYFLIIGSGTEYKKIESYINKESLDNARLYPYLPKKAYNQYLKIADIGLILLDKRFTIPNIPSRLLSYMEYSLPIIAATDINSDLRECIRAGSFGEWCENGDLKNFNRIVSKFVYNKELIEIMGLNSRVNLERNYNTKKTTQIILRHFKIDN